MNMTLTYQTKDHDFYCQDPNFIYTGEFNHTPNARLYNIVNKGSAVPTSGFHQPRWIMNTKGYSRLTVRQCFVDYFMNCKRETK